MRNTKRHLLAGDEFLAMLAHDLKTPIKAQMRALNLLDSGMLKNLSEDAQILLSNIIASNKYMQCLVDNVLGDFRLNKEAFCLNKTKNDLRKTIEYSINNVNILSEVKNQRIIINYLADEYLFFYDEIEIQRVMINVLSNAFEYARENSDIEITVSKNAGEICTVIKSLSSLVKTTDRSRLNLLKAGDGLGLSICEIIVSMHNGKFSAKPSCDGSYAVEFCLPFLNQEDTLR